MNLVAHYPSQSAHKLLTDNREMYITQSANTKNGVVAPFAAPPSESEPSPDFDDDGGALSMNGDDYAAIARDEYDLEQALGKAEFDSELFYQTLGL